MNLKQFLKPDWRKIVIFVIIIFFSLFDVFIYEKYGKSSTIIEGLCITHEFGGTECEYKLNPLFWISFNIEINGEGELYLKILTNTYLISLIYWYLLSCLIVWIYDKFRKR
jgi:hypothetical protein